MAAVAMIAGTASPALARRLPKMETHPECQCDTRHGQAGNGDVPHG